MRNVFRKIEEAWQGDALEALAEFVRLPAKSPDFDPDWEQNGVLLRALEDAARWAKVRGPLRFSRPRASRPSSGSTFPGRARAVPRSFTGTSTNSPKRVNGARGSHPSSRC